jgi:hypothetical protein
LLPYFDYTLLIILKGEGSIETFKVDAANLVLLPVAGSFHRPLEQAFYVFLAPNPNIPLIQMDSELNNHAVDPQTGRVSRDSFLMGRKGGASRWIRRSAF